MPADTNLTVRLKNQQPGLLKFDETFTLKIYNNLSGTPLIQENGIATQILTNVSSLPVGLYFLVLQHNTTIETHTIVIE